MAVTVGPGVFDNLRDQMREDYQAAFGLHYTSKYLLFFSLLSLLPSIIGVLIGIITGNNTINDIFLKIVKPWGITDHSQALLTVISVPLCLAEVAIGIYWLYRQQQLLIAIRQCRYTWRILTETGLLWFYIMSDRVSGAPPILPSAWYRFKDAVGLSPKRRQAGPGTVEAALTRLILHFDAECRQVKQRGIPAWQIALQWLISLLPIVLIPIIMIILYYSISNLIISNSAYANVLLSLFDRYYGLASYVHTIFLLLSLETVVRAIPAARRIGIRSALIHYFTTDDLAAGVPRGFPAELKSLR
jgi:hypothetical protein